MEIPVSENYPEYNPISDERTHQKSGYVFGYGYFISAMRNYYTSDFKYMYQILYICNTIIWENTLLQKLKNIHSNSEILYIIFNIKYFFSILFFILPVFFLNLQAQTQIIIIDAENQHPLEYMRADVHLISSGRKQVLYSDVSGQILVSALPDSNYCVLRISGLGYQSMTDTFYLHKASQKTYRMQSTGFQLDPVVITGQFTESTAERSPWKIKVIEREKIEAMSANNLSDVLRFENNLRFEMDPVLGTGMNMGGNSGENVKILIDGIPVIGRQNGNIDLAQIQLDNIQQIEIVEGPLSVLYGTNALAGTINLITRKPQKNTFAASAFGENSGTLRNNLYASFISGKHSFSISGMRNYFDGWNPGDPFFPSLKRSYADSGRYKLWKPRTQYSTGIKYNFRFHRHTLSLGTDYFQEQILNRGLPRAPYNIQAFDDTYSTQRIDQQLNLRGSVSGMLYTVQNAFNYFERNKNTYIRNLTTLEDKLSPGSGDQDTTLNYVIMSRATLSRSSDTSHLGIEAGYDIQHEVLTGARILKGFEAITDVAGFASVEWKVRDKLVVRPGVRWGYNSAFDMPVLPSLILKYQLHSVTFRASVARGFRVPTVKELYFLFVDINHNIQGNPDLQAETSLQWNFSADYKKRMGNTLLNSGISLFYNDIQDKINLAQVQGSLFQYINIGNRITSGGKFTNSISRKSHSLNLSAGLVIIFPPEDGTSSQQAFPSWDIVSEYRYSLERYKMNFSVFYKYQGKQNGFRVNEDKTILNTFIFPFQMADVSAGKSLYQGRFKINLGVRNLFNISRVQASMSGGAHSSESGSILGGMGRTAYIKLEWTPEFNSGKK